MGRDLRKQSDRSPETTRSHGQLESGILVAYAVNQAMGQSAGDERATIAGEVYTHQVQFQRGTATI